MIDEHIRDLTALFMSHEHIAIAVSGGVDSVTLATLAGRVHAHAEMFHAVSPAVPAEATALVREIGTREGWRLTLVNADELSTWEYRSNPLNRCYFCKRSLYETIAPIASVTSAQVMSGTNVDDLAEYRPGLDAARDFHVVHPFVELQINKRAIRGIARTLGLDHVAELPASPCLSSRVETGLEISSQLLECVHLAEGAIRSSVRAENVRCRVRRDGIVIEIDRDALATVDPFTRDALVCTVGELFSALGRSMPVSFAAYRSGSAFLTVQHA